MRAAALLTLTLAASPSAAAPAAVVLAGETTAGVPVAFRLDLAAVVQLLIAFVLPMGVGLVTSAARKAWALAGLSLLPSLLVEFGRALADGATHNGLWKTTGATAAVRQSGAPSSQPAPRGE